MKLHRGVTAFFAANERRKIYIRTIFATYILLTILAMIGDFIIGNHVDAKIEVLFALLGIASFVYYLKNDDERFGIVALTLQSMALIYALMVSNRFNVPYFHIILPLAFFVLYTPKTAFALTVVHVAVVLLLYLWGAHTFDDSFVLNNPVLWVPIIIASLYIIAFGPIYYLATEAPYRKLEESLKEKEVLLNEVHHRVKNNLNFVSAMLGLQALRLKENKSAQILRQNRARIDAIATLHEMLCSQNRFADVDMQAYLTQIARSLSSLDVQKRKVHIDANVSAPFEIALRIGMMTNELLTNSFKHNTLASPISILFTKEQNATILHYEEEGRWQKGQEKSEGIGLQIIKVLCDDIGATLEHNFTKNKSIYTVRIDDAKA